jgi:hypothetical protein
MPTFIHESRELQVKVFSDRRWEMSIDQGNCIEVLFGSDGLQTPKAIVDLDLLFVCQTQCFLPAFFTDVKTYDIPAFLGCIDRITPFSFSREQEAPWLGNGIQTVLEIGIGRSSISISISGIAFVPEVFHRIRIGDSMRIQLGFSMD